MTTLDEDLPVSDPVIRAHWPAVRIHILAIAAILAGFGYLTWRLFGSQTGATLWMFWLLIAAEAFGWLSLILHAHETWRVLPSRRKTPLDLSVDVLVPTYDEGPNILEATLVGCLAIRGNVTVWILDDGKREWVRQLAESFGFQYVTRKGNKNAKAGNINHALPLLQGELILALDADHVPAPDILEAMTGYFIDPKVALVQSPHFFRNRDSAQHSSAENHEQGLFFEVLLPGREHLDAVFWCGSGALIRTSALKSIGGVATRTITEDLETSLVLQRAGYTIKYHHEHLLQGLAPHNLAAYLIQRDRWARGTLRVLFLDNSPLRAPGWRLRTRVAYLGNLFYYIMPIQRMLFAILMIITLWTAFLPVGTIPYSLMVAWGVWTALAMTASWGMSRGNQRPMEGDLNTWVTARPYLNAWLVLITRKKSNFKVTPKEGIDEGGVHALHLLKLPTIMLCLTAFSLIIRIVVQVIGAVSGNWYLPKIEQNVMLFIGFFALWEIITLTRTIYRFTKRRQYRLLWRFPVDLSGTLGTQSARIIDLHEAGARILVDASTAMEMKMPLRVNVHDPHGQLIEVSGVFIPRSNHTTDEGLLSVGGVCAWDSVKDRRAVIFETHVYEPFSATKKLEQQNARP
jgi:cellulose synthase (UDP-forming)